MTSVVFGSILVVSVRLIQVSSTDFTSFCCSIAPPSPASIVHVRSVFRWNLSVSSPNLLLLLRIFFSKDKIFKRLVAFFHESDSDKDGFLTMRELTTTLRKYGYDGTDEEIMVGMGSTRSSAYDDSVPAIYLYQSADLCILKSLRIHNGTGTLPDALFVFSVCKAETTGHSFQFCAKYF